MQHEQESFLQTTLHDPVAFFTACLVVVTGLLWIFTARLWRTTAAMARDANEAAKLQGEKFERSISEAAAAARAMERQNELTEHSQRAWVDIQIRDPVVQITSDRIAVSWAIEWRNIGKSVAAEVRLESRWTDNPIKWVDEYATQIRNGQILAADPIALMPGESAHSRRGRDQQTPAAKGYPSDGDKGLQIMVLVLASAVYRLPGQSADSPPKRTIRAFYLQHAKGGGFFEKELGVFSGDEVQIIKGHSQETS